MLLGLENVGFTGGEPLLRKKDLVSLLKFCKTNLKTKTHLHTNGTLIGPEEASILAQLVDEVTVTFYGSTEKTHDLVTSIPGSLKATEKGLHRLADQRANVTVYIVPMRQNYTETPEIIRKVSDYCHKIRILSLSPTGRARDSFGELSLRLDDIELLRQELDEIQNELDINIEAGFCTRQDFPELGKLAGHQSCFAAENRVHIDASGEIFPCTASSGWKEFSAGNIKQRSFDLEGVWRFSPIFQFIRFFHHNPPSRCRGCVLYHQCMGGCRVMMYYKHRDITATRLDCKSSKTSQSSIS